MVKSTVKNRRGAPASRKAKVTPRKLSRLFATALPRLDEAPARGRLLAGPTTLLCAIGTKAVSHRKREGDLASPAGKFRLLQGFFKPEAGPRPVTRLPLRPLDKNLGWCDDPASANYNRLIHLPSSDRHEDMWRADGLYDLVFVLDYNIAARRKYRGSAIFLHCAQADLAPTAGCIALRATALRKLLPRLARNVTVTIR